MQGPVSSGTRQDGGCEKNVYLKKQCEPVCATECVHKLKLANVLRGGR